MQIVIPLHCAESWGKIEHRRCECIWAQHFAPVTFCAENFVIPITSAIESTVQICSREEDEHLNCECILFQLSALVTSCALRHDDCIQFCTDDNRLDAVLRKDEASAQSTSQQIQRLLLLFVSSHTQIALIPQKSPAKIHNGSKCLRLISCTPISCILPGPHAKPIRKVPLFHRASPSPKPVAHHHGSRTALMRTDREDAMRCNPSTTPSSSSISKTTCHLCLSTTRCTLQRPPRVNVCDDEGSRERSQQTTLHSVTSSSSSSTSYLFVIKFCG